MKVTPPKEPSTLTKEERVALACQREIETLVAELVEQINAQSDIGEDASVPVYQWAQQINSQITKAQGGSGPFRKRYMIAAELALRAVLVIDRSKS